MATEVMGGLGLDSEPLENLNITMFCLKGYLLMKNTVLVLYVGVAVFVTFLGCRESPTSVQTSPPIITKQPNSQTISTGQADTLSVSSSLLSMEKKRCGYYWSNNEQLYYYQCYDWRFRAL